MKQLVLTTTLAAVLLGLAACRSTEVTYVDPAGNEGIATVGKIDVQDWGEAARQSIDTLLASGVLKRHDGRRSVVTVSRVKNHTREHVDTDLLTKKIRVAMLRSGQAITTTATSVRGAEDEANMAVRQLRDAEEFDQSTVPDTGQLKAPDYSLAGKIIQLDAEAGRKHQTAFAFQMTLTNLRTGLAEWEDEVQIIKQGRRPGIGW